MDLTDTKGYRAKYINALNEASKRHRIVGGDVTPLETDGGTLLRIPALAETCRFQLFVGATEILDKPITPTFCVADGSFFVAGELIKLKSCTNTMYKKEGICPTSSGWALKAEGKDGWKTCDVEILKYEETYYLGFHFDNEKRYPLISDTATEDIESQISVVVKIGTFNAPINDTTIVQIVKSDIFYGGERIEKLLPWDIINEEGEWYVVNPIWTLPKPTLAEGITEPIPLEAIGLPKKADNSTLESVEVKGKTCYKLTDIVVKDNQNLYTHVYAVMMADGHFGLSLRTSKNGIKETANCVYLGQFTRDEKNPDTILSWAQNRSGSIASKWTETEPFFVESNSSGNTRYVEAPIGLEEGTTMFRYRFWKLRTEINESLYREDEDLDFQGDGTLKKEQISTTYGNYIWRHRLFYDKKSKALLVDEVTTAVLNVEVSTFATLMPTPYVTRVEVTYPESPLQQGSVDAVGGTINVLAVGETSTSRTRLFNTESIDTTDGSLIEVE